MNRDFRDLFSAFNDADVRYLVVGAYAVIHYTEPRYTKDLDIWVEPSQDNAVRVYRSLASFGAPMDNLGVDDLSNPDVVFQIGIEPNRIDTLMGLGDLVGRLIHWTSDNASCASSTSWRFLTDCLDQAGSWASPDWYQLSSANSRPSTRDRRVRRSSMSPSCFST